LATQSPLHMWRPALQAGTHWPLVLHVTLPFAGGTHTVQVFPHDAMLVLPLATHRLPLQVWNPVAHVAPQVVPVQTAVPLGGETQALQPTAVHPEARVLFATQTFPHRWYPVLQAGTQAPAALHVTVPFAGAVHTRQLLPHDVMLRLPLTTQVAPQAWYPVVQFTPQARGVPLQVAVPFVGTAQGVQAAAVAVVPQAVRLVLRAHMLPQRW
jgi:hypothetical protein